MSVAVAVAVIVAAADGIGADTLRCLGMAIVEEPGPKEEMNLEDSKNFVQYEVSQFCRATWCINIGHLAPQPPRQRQTKMYYAEVGAAGIAASHLTFADQNHQMTDQNLF